MKKNSAIRELQSQFGLKACDPAIVISISQQKLYLITGEKVIKRYLVSTSQYGIGNKEGSYKTPLGMHCIANKIGRNARCGEIFKTRRRTGKIAKINSGDLVEDVITTRILRLKGLEPGINKGEGIDSYGRNIYIHGTPAEHLIGKPSSHGCIRMRNRDVIELFNVVKRDSLVEIQA